METSAKLYSLNYSNVKTYLFALLFIAGNIVLPQLCHLTPYGGPTLLPIYFFTLVAGYKYGFRVGLLTAILSPVINHLLFAMPSEAALPVILIKSTLLAGASALAARTLKSVSLLGVLGVVLSYQIIGTAFEWAILGNFHAAVQDFRIGIPGMLIQWFGGYALLKAIAKL
ncbi:ECF transporter S component [Bacteroides acidifaciens]|uniref:ECF transporter S component n=1 Tax=Bacteroides acidifaciens TaxID=85831 RepID=UPI00158F1E4C|nr:ECF transporter S component [Bacteroides acidifaciens]